MSFLSKTSSVLGVQLTSLYGPEPAEFLSRYSLALSWVEAFSESSPPFFFNNSLSKTQNALPASFAKNEASGSESLTITVLSSGVSIETTPSAWNEALDFKFLTRSKLHLTSFDVNAFPEANFKLSFNLNVYVVLVPSTS